MSKEIYTVIDDDLEGVSLGNFNLCKKLKKESIEAEEIELLLNEIEGLENLQGKTFASMIVVGFQSPKGTRQEKKTNNEVSMEPNHILNRIMAAMLKSSAFVHFNYKCLLWSEQKDLVRKINKISI